MISIKQIEDQYHRALAAVIKMEEEGVKTAQDKAVYQELLNRLEAAGVELATLDE